MHVSNIQSSDRIEYNSDIEIESPHTESQHNHTNNFNEENIEDIFLNDNWILSADTYLINLMFLLIPIKT